MELPVEHGLLLDNLLDLAHAPFTHTSTFAKGWSVPRNKTRLLYRMSLDFAPVLQHIPFMHHLWRHFAEKVLNEDLRLVLGQQDRMINGANVWNWPVSYDKLGSCLARYGRLGSSFNRFYRFLTIPILIFLKWNRLYYVVLVVGFGIETGFSPSLILSNNNMRATATPASSI
ncbi:hypothetical protein R6Q57_021143 [Mikania cordata]